MTHSSGPSYSRDIAVLVLISALLLGLGVLVLVTPFAYSTHLYVGVSLVLFASLVAYIRHTFVSSLQSLENYLQEVVAGRQPDSPRMPAAWLMVSKQVRAITTYLQIMRQSQADREAILEESRADLKDKDRKLRENQLALERVSDLESQARGKLETEGILQGAIDLAEAQLSPRKLCFLKLNAEQPAQAQVMYASRLQHWQAEQSLDVSPLLALLPAPVRTEADPTFERVVEEPYLAWKPEGTLWEGEPWQGCLVARVRLGGEPFGLLCLFDKEARGNQFQTFAEEDRKILRNLVSNLQKDLKAANLFELATVDALSRLYIRRYFERLLETELKRARRYHMPLSVLMLDIDHFKKFNDTYGHLTGDEVIQLVAGRVKLMIRQDIDMVGRYGGEEMVVFLPQTPLPDAKVVAERIRNAIETLEVPMLRDKKPMPHVTISIGISSYPTHADDLKSLIEFADKGLYLSKENGRNRTSVFSLPQP